MLASQKDALGVDRHHPVPLVRLPVLDGNEGHRDGGIVHKNVDPAVRCLHLAECRLPLRFVGHVKMMVMGRSTRGGQRPHAFNTLCIGDIR
jgi:hypothetical protein